VVINQHFIQHSFKLNLWESLAVACGHTYAKKVAPYHNLESSHVS
jgi:hypothetical protein